MQDGWFSDSQMAKIAIFKYRSLGDAFAMRTHCSQSPDTRLQSPINQYDGGKAYRTVFGVGPIFLPFLPCWALALAKQNRVRFGT